MESNQFTVLVSYALPQQQWVETISVPAGSTVADVLAQCKTLAPFAQLDLAEHKIGILGKVVELTQLVQAGDRIEIYRPLICDPKEARRKRALTVSSSMSSTLNKDVP